MRDKERFTVVCPCCRQNPKIGHFTLLESLSKDHGYGNENVITKYDLALSQVFRDYSVLFTLYNTAELSCNWMGTNGFKVKTENEWFIVICSRQKNARKSVLQVQHECFSSFNQRHSCFVVLP